MNKNNRRNAIYKVMVSAGLVAATAGMPFAYAQSEPVRVGILSPKQGPSAAIGINMARGAEMAVAMHKSGTVLGKKVEVVWLEEATPQISQQNMQRLATEYKVAGVIGANSSASAFAAMSVAAREKVPLMVAGAAAREITGESCNRYTFRTQASAPVQISEIENLIAGKKMYFMTPSYAFGQDVLRSAREVLPRAGAKEVGNDEVPVNTADYSSYILKIRQAKPDAVLGSVVGMDLSNFMKQWQELGMKDRVPFMQVAVTDTDFWDIGPKAATGIHVKPWYFNNKANTELEMQFIAEFTKKFNQPPSDKAWSGWFAMRSLIESIEAAGTTRSADVVKSLEKWKAADSKYPVYYREWDHQLIRPSVVVQVKKNVTDKWDYFDVLQGENVDPQKVAQSFGEKDAIGCKMGAL